MTRSFHGSCSSVIDGGEEVDVSTGRINASLAIGRRRMDVRVLSFLERARWSLDEDEELQTVSV